MIIGSAILLRHRNRFVFELQKKTKWTRTAEGAPRIGLGCIGGTVEILLELRRLDPERLARCLAAE